MEKDETLMYSHSGQYKLHFQVHYEMTRCLMVATLYYLNLAGYGSLKLYIYLDIILKDQHILGCNICIGRVLQRQNLRVKDGVGQTIVRKRT